MAKHLPEAIDDLQHAQKLQPDSTAITYQLATAYRLAGRTEESNKLFAQISNATKLQDAEFRQSTLMGVMGSISMRITLPGRHILRQILRHSMMANLLLTGFHNSHAQVSGSPSDCDSIVEHAQRSLEQENAAEATAAIMAALPSARAMRKLTPCWGFRLMSSIGTPKPTGPCAGHRSQSDLGALSQQPGSQLFARGRRGSGHGRIPQSHPWTRTIVLPCSTLRPTTSSRKDFSHALQYLKAAKAESSGDPELQMLLIKAYLGAGSTEEASQTALYPP